MCGTRYTMGLSVRLTPTMFTQRERNLILLVINLLCHWPACRGPRVVDKKTPCAVVSLVVDMLFDVRTAVTTPIALHAHVSWGHCCCGLYIDHSSW